MNPMRKLISLFLSLILLVSLGSAVAEESTFSLVGHWYCSDGNSVLIHTLVFNEDGTGSAISFNQNLDILSWSMDGNQIYFDYMFNGSVHNNDMYSIGEENGQYYILFTAMDQTTRRFYRTSASIAGSWFCNDGDSILIHTLVFNEDGTGSAIAFNTTLDILAWGTEGNQIYFDYMFNGERRNNDMYSLAVENGETVIVFNSDTKTRTFRRAQSAENQSTPVSIEDVTGTWSCQLSDSVCTLVLNDDGTAVLTVLASTYHCTWERSGPKFALHQNGSTISGVYSGTTITLNISGLVLEFTR